MTNYRSLRFWDLARFDWYDREVRIDPVLPGLYHWDITRFTAIPNVVNFFRLREGVQSSPTLQDVESGAGKTWVYVAVGALPGGEMLLCHGGRAHVVPEHFLRGLELTRAPGPQRSVEVMDLLGILKSDGLERPGSESERMAACRDLAARGFEADFEFTTSAEFIARSEIWTDHEVTHTVRKRTMPNLWPLTREAARPLPPPVRRNGQDVHTARVIARIGGTWGIDHETNVVKWVQWNLRSRTTDEMIDWLTAPWLPVEDVLTVPFSPMDTVKEKALYFDRVADTDFGSPLRTLQGWMRYHGPAFARSGKRDYVGDVRRYRSAARFLTTSP
jgi:hypothetical protein